MGRLSLRGVFTRASKSAPAVDEGVSNDANRRNSLNLAAHLRWQARKGMTGPIESLASEKASPSANKATSADGEPTSTTVAQALTITLAGPGDALSPSTWGQDLHHDLHGGKKKQERKRKSVLIEEARLAARKDAENTLGRRGLVRGRASFAMDPSEFKHDIGSGAGTSKTGRCVSYGRSFYRGSVGQ